MKRIAILGIGKSGLSAARWAVSQGVECILSDVLPIDRWPKELVSWCKENSIIVDSGGHSKKKILASQLIIPSPGIPLNVPILAACREKKIPIIGELALSLGFWNGPRVGITGTNGKTTCTALVGHMLIKSGLPCFVGGNMGTPVLENIGEGNNKGAILVAEVSSFQLDLFPMGKEAGRTIEAVKTIFPGFDFKAFDVAILLNISQDHLERYRDFDHYIRSKARIFQLQAMGAWAIVEKKALELLTERGLGPRARRIILEGAPLGERLTLSWPEGGTEGYALHDFTPIGAHNRENLLAAIYAARIMGARQSAIQQVIDTFHTHGHRLELVAERDGIRFIDDSKATNVHATLAAIKAMDRPVVLICGGLPKGQDFSPLGTHALKQKVKGVVTMGKAAEELASVLDWAPNCRINGQGDGWEKMRRAVRAAREMASPGDAVLLSPACSSFDLFTSYGDRGDAFKAAVEEL